MASPNSLVGGEISSLFMDYRPQWMKRLFFDVFIG